MVTFEPDQQQSIDGKDRSGPHFERLRAKRRGETRYFSGKPCPKGHVSQRMVSNGRCCQCMKEYKLQPENVKRELERLKKDREQNPEKYKEIWKKQRTIVKNKVTHSMYVRLSGVVTRKYRSKSFEKIFGYTPEMLIDHLERQFTKGMSWENHGEWHIDHIIPVKHFKYVSQNCDDFKNCWAITNLRPIWADINQKKSFNRTLLL